MLKMIKLLLVLSISDPPTPTIIQNRENDEFIDHNTAVKHRVDQKTFKKCQIMKQRTEKHPNVM